MKKDLIVNVALPYATYLLLHHVLHQSTVTSLAVGAIFPIVSIIVTSLVERRVQAIGIVVLTATLASIAGSVFLDSPTLLLAKGSLITGVIGLVFAGSLLAPRPLVFYVVTGEAPEIREEADALWNNVPRYRQVMRIITIAWAVALLVEASVRLVLIPLLPIEIFLPVSETMWVVFFIPMIAWSRWYGKRETEKLEAGAAKA